MSVSHLLGSRGTSQAEELAVLYYDIDERGQEAAEIEIAWFGPSVVQQKKFKLRITGTTTVGDAVGRLGQMAPLTGTGDIRLLGVWDHRIVWIGHDPSHLLCSVHSNVELRAEEVGPEAYASGQGSDFLVRICHVLVHFNAPGGQGQFEATKDPFLLSVSAFHTISDLRRRIAEKTRCSSGLRLSVMGRQGLRPTRDEDLVEQIVGVDLGEYLCIETQVSEEIMLSHEVDSSNDLDAFPMSEFNILKLDDTTTTANSTSSFQNVGLTNPAPVALLNRLAGLVGTSRPTSQSDASSPQVASEYHGHSPNSGQDSQPNSESGFNEAEYQGLLRDLQEVLYEEERKGFHIRQQLEALRAAEEEQIRRQKAEVGDKESEIGRLMQLNTEQEREIRTLRDWLILAEQKIDDLTMPPRPAVPLAQELPNRIKELSEIRLTTASEETLNEIEQEVQGLLDKLKKEKQARNRAVPDGFRCSITQDIMQDPVVHTSPLTNLPVYVKSCHEWSRS